MTVGRGGGCLLGRVQAAPLRRGHRSSRGCGRECALEAGAPGPSGEAVPLGARADATARGGCVASSFPLRSISFRADFFQLIKDVGSHLHWRVYGARRPT